MVGMVGMRPQGLFYLYLCRRGTASFARYAHIRSYSIVLIGVRSSTQKIDSLLDTNFRLSGTRTRSMLENMVLDRALGYLLCFGYQYSPYSCDNYAGEGKGGVVAVHFCTVAIARAKNLSIVAILYLLVVWTCEEG